MTNVREDVSSLNGRIFGEQQLCFGCGPSHPFGFHLHFDVFPDSVVTRFTPGPMYQGPPGIFHGGLVMTLADELASYALIGLLHRFGFTVGIEGKLRRALRVDEEIVGTARIRADRRRLVDIHVVLEQGGEIGFEGELRFALLETAAAERLLGQPLPDDWKHWTRQE